MLVLVLSAALSALVLGQAPAYAAPVSQRAVASVAGYYRVADAGALNLRSGPGTDYPVLMSMPEGEIVQALGDTTAGPHYEWYHVVYRGTEGYAASDWLKPVRLVGTQIASRYTRVVIVSLAQQQLEAYQDGKLVLISSVTTGRPELPTPAGTYSILAKKSPTTFHSPWPEGSPYYYEPTHIEYAMLFRSGGFYIHDAPWKLYHGYGTDAPHTDPDGVRRTGSLGCVEMPAWSAAQLYHWIGLGTPVVVTSD